ncbi:MAG TPA: cobyric acid synthase [Rhodospirillales bacterium]|nr:cobyric acid synthase [Rhodospirillales bacterium]
MAASSPTPRPTPCERSLPATDNPTCRALMFQGTGSDVGKSLLVAGLCRAYHNRGLKVRPFKPQNMSNNAAVTTDGGEIGRAQALQARAAHADPSVHMNPVLLKPESDTGAQVVVQGKVMSTVKAGDYHTLKPKLLDAVLQSFKITCADADLVLVEGAGSAAEVNLRAGDIANFGFAQAAQVPVVLIGDVDRGGVIAAIVGTHVLLSRDERDLLTGYIINKFRGDPTLFASADPIITEHTGLRSFGLVPHFADARLLPKEDALSLDSAGPGQIGEAVIRIAVPRLSRIANFDDLDPLAAEPGVVVDIIEPGSPLPGDAQVVIIPGSKATLADLEFFRAEGWQVDLAAHVRRGGQVIGLCGGYQMLGHKLSDPGGREGPAGTLEGLGLLDVETILSDDKTLETVIGQDQASGEKIHGYEMHIGLTEGPDRARPWLKLSDGRGEGAVSGDGKIRGTYVHGLFAADQFRHAFLENIRSGRGDALAYESQIEQTLDGLAAHLETHLNLDALLDAAAVI